MLQTDSGTLESSKIPWTKENLAELRAHVGELTSSSAFKGSRRSAQFLKYIVDESIDGHLDALKERVIGVELFGRAPSYDTGEDAIVRVTASDVRRRLLQHYGSSEARSSLRISLPLGSYVPEITRLSAPAPILVELVPQTDGNVPPPLSTNAAAQIDKRLKVRWALFGACASLALIGAVVLVWSYVSTRSAAQSSAIWTPVFHNDHATQLVTSDPNIAEIQGLTNAQISVSDYANGKYVPVPNTLTPEVLHFCQWILRGNKSALVDGPIVANISAIAHENGKQIRVVGAREVRLPDLRTDNNFIFLGSPHSDPWAAMFNDELDFRMVYDESSRQELVQNVHPQQGEASSYAATAMGYGTGQSFATLSFIGNPDHAGQVLLISGINAEGTEAAGALAADGSRLAAALKHCDIVSSQQVLHFQILLRLNMMAGSPSNVDVIACHRLPNGSPQ